VTSGSAAPLEARARALATRSTADALAYLAALSPSSIRLGLDRIHAALERLGHPEARLKVLHVAGTNGKGSTCAFAASCLSQRYTTGLYTSPHLERVNERIQIGGEPIADEAFGLRIVEVLERLPAEHDLSYFEFGTVVALWHFAQEKVEVAVLETGLGGRLDATTACRPLVTAITSISFDHTALLGTTLASIAREKAGIIKKGVPVVTCQQAPEAQSVIWDAARKLEAPLFVEGREFALEPVAGGGLKWMGLSGRVDGLTLPLRGRHQLQNAALALACLDVLGEKGLRLSEKELRQGLAATRWPGRFEVFEGTPTVVLDGAHNPDGVATLVRALDELYPGRKVHLVFGVLGDKDSTAMMQTLLPRCASVDLAPVDSPRSLDPMAYAATASRFCPVVTPHTDARKALERARARSDAHDVVVVAGSLVLLGQLRPHVRAGLAGLTG
jgi:dihydrofolate synthase/folylpolyglutamate synthase